MLVAVADAGLENLERGGQADGRPLLDDRVDVAREPLGAQARGVGADGRLLGLGADLGRVALEEGLRVEVALEVGGRGAGGEVARDCLLYTSPSPRDS